MSQLAMPNEEIVELLRELRDQQKRYAEWHKNFAEQLIDQQRQRDQEAQLVAEKNQAYLRKTQREFWFVFAIIVFVLILAGPFGDWVMHMVSRW